MAADTHNENVQSKDPAASSSPAGASPLAGPLGIFISVVLFGVAGFLVWRTLNTAKPPVPDPPSITYMCSETGKTFPHVPVMDETIPVVSPHSKKKTGYRVEWCYCVIDGTASTEPTPVILNEDLLGKDVPTTCPKCKANVYRHNADNRPSSDPKTGTRPATTQPADA